ncbi:MAG TPA: DUF3422 domain-containing protein [Candidatus Competibacteraceae bacterium]|nr:DUF3422 domain-containing protein [Candidatus Competibacteraceae bacterium]
MLYDPTDAAIPTRQWAVPGIAEHRWRERLSNEIHARGSLALKAPVRASHLALLAGEDGVERDRLHIVDLCRRFGAPEPPMGANFWHVDCGPFVLNWERHTEFSSYTFIRHEPFDEPFREPVIRQLPQDWLRGLAGEVLVAMHLALEPAVGARLSHEQTHALFASDNIASSHVSGGAAQVWTDFRLQGDGFCRVLIRDISLTPRQAGRVLQRLIEIETYRMMALLALPLAREYGRQVTHADQTLADITQRMADADRELDQHTLLDRLTAVAAEIERIAAATNYRFGAARAYYALVQRRIEELREVRVDGHPTIKEFMDRRLAPAMSTCESLRDRLEVLSKRVSRAANLLRTRVDLALERQNQDLLRSMDRRAQLQLRLQETVEGLSVVVLSYYVVGLVGYLFKAAKSGGLPLNPELATGLTLPLVVGGVWWGIHRFRRSLGHDSG